MAGVLPIEIVQLYQLEYLDLSINSFPGSIPQKLFNISTVQSFGLVDNGLTGGLPSNLCYGSPLLLQLYLGGNNLSGAIPNSISNCIHLTRVDLSSNRFTDFVPHSLGNLSHLQLLDLKDKSLRNEPSSSELSFITSLTRCRSLIVLRLGDNPLHGIIPSSIGEFSSSLQTLDIYTCEIKGSIPASTGNLRNLISLSLYNNKLSGNIPRALDHLHKLQVLHLSNNRLSGPIPKGLCYLQFINKLYLDKNQFSGSIPECFENITSLREVYLDSNKLNSSIPTSFWRLTDLLKLNLSSNSLGGNLSSDRTKNEIISNLSGPIPKSLEKIQDLDYFNVSFNDLSGEIPSDSPFKKFTAESFKENKALCGILRFHVPICPVIPKHRFKREKVKFALYILAGAVALITLVSLAFIFLRYRINNKATSENFELVSTMPERISYREILQSTEKFKGSNLLGIGSYGSVYRGILKDGKVIAVKVSSLQNEASFGSFEVECNVLRNIRHRNLTKVISSCSNENFRALVLEYMPMGNLEKWLYSHNYCLDIGQRLNIMIDVACALEYLHHGYFTPIVHCDLKPSNMLLDEEMIAHLSDFGIAKLLGDGESIVQTKTFATLGYIAPEYGLEGLVSTRCDVYSYGIMLLETFTRKRPSNDMFGGDLNLKSWVESLLPQSLNQVMDVNLLTNIDDENCDKMMHCVFSILVLALKCSADSPSDRINMKDALSQLQKIKHQFFSDEI